MAIDRLDIVIQGAGPYGFRLTGGDGRPIAVTKLRRQSKACDAGVQEGDILLGINGFECRTMSHSSAMALLEDAVDSISLAVFRGSLDEVDRAYDAVSSSFRPLSPGSIPPPRVLPPPPTAAVHSSGDLVIDQPSFSRQHWPLQKPQTSPVAPPPPPLARAQPAHPHPAPIAEPRSLEACPPQPMPTSDASLPTFRVKPFSGGAKQWTPYGSAASQHPHHQQPVQQHQQPSGTFNVVAHNLPDRPLKWQPTETPVLVRTHAEVDLDPKPVPESADTTSPHGRVSLRVEHANGPGGDNVVEVVPRWALPLRSDYDWREFYHWGEDDEWEITDDGQYCLRKRKIFADSSFYDDPEHKYPTIEEQIRMARKVAQSLTSSGNVKARGQRMFLRRREKADHWAADALGTRQAVRRAAAARAAADLSESEAEMPYYNPTPWSAGAARSPWAQHGGTTPSNPSWMPSRAAGNEQSPSGGGNLWHPVRFTEPTAAAAMPRHIGNVPPQVAFGLAKDLARMHDKGGRMFAKLRARAAVEETEDYTSEVMHADVMRRIADSYVPAAAHGPTRHDVMVDNGLELQTSASSRLMEMIERNRATTGVSAAGPAHHSHSAAARPVNFASSKSQSGFRPVRFKAPLVVTAADIFVDDVAAQEEAEGGISDF